MAQRGPAHLGLGFRRALASVCFDVDLFCTFSCTVSDTQRPKGLRAPDRSLCFDGFHVRLQSASLLSLLGHWEVNELPRICPETCRRNQNYETKVGMGAQGTEALSGKRFTRGGLLALGESKS